VLPVAEDGSKRPDVSSWLSYQTTRPTAEDMRAFDFAHRCGHGMIAGAVSGCAEAWDFDCPDVFAAFVDEAETCALGDVVQRIRAGYEDETPAGGRRWIVRYPGNVNWRDCTLARRPGGADEPKVKTLIELPTFAILAPSNGGVHPSGRPYVRRSGDFSTIAKYTIEERAELFALARSFDAMPRPELRAASKSQPGTRPGDDYNSRTTWPELLEPAGWSRVYERGNLTAWRRPGKMHGVSATTNVGGSDLFYCFSSSTPFEPDKSYSKFGVYTVLEHAGDYAAAARTLSAQGYGTSTVQAGDSSSEQAHAVLTRLSLVTPTDVDWLWTGRLARGKYTLLAGDPGIGKSSIVLDCASRLSRGTAWPDGTPCPCGTTLLLTAEDGLADTVRPHVDRYGGDPNQIIVLEAVQDAGGRRPLDLARDIAVLIAAIRDVRPALVGMDPITAYLGRTDAHRDAEVRGLLAPLQAALDEYQAAFVAVAHLNKDQTRAALHRPSGSIAFIAAARLAFVVAADPQNAERTVLAPLKCNLCRRPEPLAFRFDADRLLWESTPAVGLDAESLLHSAMPDNREDQTDAERLLAELLEDDSAWPMEAKVALEAARAHGIHEQALRRAARRAGVRIARLGFGHGGRWLWHRPFKDDKPATYGIEPTGMSPMAPMEQPTPIDAIDNKKSVRSDSVTNGVTYVGDTDEAPHPDYLWRDPEER
jgi:hypothetical protein